MSEDELAPNRIRRSLQETRQLVLDAGLRLAVDLGVRPLVDVKLIDAVDEVGLTTGSAYKIWKNQGEFQNALALHLASSFEWARISDLVPDLEPDPAKWNAWKLADAYFRAFIENRAFFVALQLWGVADPSEELSAAMRGGYAVVDRDTEGVVNLYLDLYRRRIKELFRMKDVVTALSVTAEGSALRYKFDPDALESSDRDSYGLYSDVVKAILEFYTEPIDEVQDSEAGPSGAKGH